MNLFELGILVVYYIKFKTSASDVALLVRADNRYPESWCRAGSHGSTRAETACVRVMQAQAEKGYAPSDYYLFTTERPTPMCLGMTRRCHIKEVIFLDRSRIRCNNWQNFNGGPQRLTQAMEEMIAGIWVPESPWRDLEAKLRANVPSVGQAIARKNAQAMTAWLVALSNIREASYIWLTLPHNRELQPVPAPRFRGVPLNRAHAGMGTALRDKIYMTLTFALLDCARKGANAGVGALAGQQIAAVLVGPDGKLLSWGVNTNAGNVTRHGETNCLQTFFAQAEQDVPEGSTLYTTLRSCEMCAGMLATVARNLRVIYGGRDPGVGVTALQLGLNGCSEQRFSGSSSDPIARAKFQRVVALAMQQAHAERVQAVARTGETLFRETHRQAPPAPGATQEERRDAAIVYRRQVIRSGADLGALYAFLHPSGWTGIDTRPLPEAVTNALNTPRSRRNIAGYRRLYQELGMMLLARYQFRPGRDFMGFTRAELQEIVEREERQLPVLRYMTDSDFEAWSEADTLLQQVQRGALRQ
jgi:tRNA(Arg) A34 adenosine deaminase TadA